MGTGKSRVVLALVADLKPAVVLIVTVKAAMRQWEEYFRDDAPGTADVYVLDGGSTKQKVDWLQESVRTAALDQPTVIVTNYDSVWRQPLGDALLRLRPEMVVLDESQKIKAAGSRVSRYFARYPRLRGFRLCLTGTPLHDTPVDAYGQFRFLDPSVFGTNFEIFMKRYTVREPRQNYLQVTAYVNQNEMAQKMAELSFRVEQDVLGLDEPIHSTLWVELEPETKKMYDTMLRDYVLQLDAGPAIGQNALVRNLRLLQITSGHLPVNQMIDGKQVQTLQVVGNEKKKALEDYLDGIDRAEPVVVFTNFTADVLAAREVFKSRGRNVYQLADGLDEWREWRDSTTPGDGLIANEKSGGAAVNLTRAHRVVYYSTSYSLGDYEQSLARLQRGGQTKTVLVHHIVARNTVDEYVRDAVRSKKDVVSYVHDRLRSAVASGY